MSFSNDLATVKQKASDLGINWDDDLFGAAFGKGTYRWLVETMGITYMEGMEIGLFDLHQEYRREDLEAKDEMATP